MDCRLQERYQTLYPPAAGVFPNEVYRRPRGRAQFGRPSRDAAGGDLNLRRARYSGSRRGVQAISWRSNRGHAHACLPAGGPSRLAPSLDSTAPDCRRERVDNADRPGGARHGVSGLPPRSTRAGSLFHAGAANVSTRPHVFTGSRCPAGTGCGPDPCHLDCIDGDYAADRKPLLLMSILEPRSPPRLLSAPNFSLSSVAALSQRLSSGA